MFYGGLHRSFFVGIARSKPCRGEELVRENQKKDPYRNEKLKLEGERKNEKAEDKESSSYLCNVLIDGRAF
jgi:hypothetical protein